MEEELHGALAPLHNAGDLLIPKILTKSEQHHLLLIVGQHAHRFHHVRSAFQNGKGEFGSRLKIESRFKFFFTTHNRLTAETSGHDIARDAVEPSREGDPSPFISVNIFQCLMKRFRDDILGDGSIAGSLIGVCVNRIDITFIQGAEGDRI